MHSKALQLLAHGLGVALVLFTQSVSAIDKSAVEKRYHTRFDLYLTAREAHDLKTSNPDKVLFVDVRSRQELHYTGIADQVDANIPYRMDTLNWRMKKDGLRGTFRTKRNPDFADAVAIALRSRQLNRKSPVILMCGAASRAAFAADALYKAGFERVYIQVEGFEGVKAISGKHKGKRSVVAGWKYEGLPWGYDLIAEKMYFNFDPKNQAELVPTTR
ncbi:MAG: sulfurtransferase [Desulfofustis sp.]|nr:sulfurtransferase [Desulfofustis sp.]